MGKTRSRRGREKGHECVQNTHIDFAAAADVVVAAAVAVAGTFAAERDSSAARREHEGWHRGALRPSKQDLLVLLGLRPCELQQTAEASHHQVRLVQSWEACLGPWGGRRRQDVPSQQDAP